MLTLFTIPKPFVGVFDAIQRNAIASWTRLHPECEVILFGDEEGVARAAAELGVRQIPAVACNEHGTPRIDDVFAQARAVARHDRLCFVNTDILLLPEFVRAVARLQGPRYLMVGQRWDIEVRGLLDFTDTGWAAALRREVARNGVRQPPWAIDYFVIPRTGVAWDFPPFAVGRIRWDNWFLWRAGALRVPVIDATWAVLCVHQKHPRTYSSINKPPVAGQDNTRDSAEARKNLELAKDKYGDIRDATWLMTPNFALLPAITPRRLYRMVKRPLLRWLGLGRPGA